MKKVRLFALLSMLSLILFVVLIIWIKSPESPSSLRSGKLVDPMEGVDSVKLEKSTAKSGLWRSQNQSPATSKENSKQISGLIKSLKKRAESRRFDWDLSVFSQNDLNVRGKTVHGRPLVFWTCGSKNSGNRSLILSAVHGDEITPVFFGFRLIEYLKSRPHLCKNNFVVVAPTVNPDGFLRYRTGTRTNYNKVDLNRNFNTPDWKKDAHRLWKTKYSRRRRYYPGAKPLSEPETRFQKWLIDEFKPHKILSIHAPLNILDYDGPRTSQHQAFTKKYIESCEGLKKEMKKATKLLKFHVFGRFPGSLGNYAGRVLGIPTLTTELPTTNPKKAGYYFGKLEAATNLFIKHQVNLESSDSPN